MKKYLFFIVIILIFSFPKVTKANENQFVTIVNPVRISPYTKNSAESISAEYEIIQKNDLPATWLLTYDVLADEQDTKVLRNMDDNQELGLFMEVGPKLCKKAGITCNEGSWHHANVIFLSGYKQEDRKKLIDTLFSSFKEKLGYYPKSVGSWWTDAYSLSYLQEKYGISANLTCSDQFSTDGYQIWGQYWMHPFVPSKYHAGMPAVSSANQLDLVTIQWAPRDPVNGYESSLYSSQDYQTSPLSFDTSYFENLIKTYGFKNNNSFGQITVGLEGDYNPNDYQGEYTKQISAVKRIVDQDELDAVTMSQFSSWYRDTFSKTPASFIQSDDFLGSGKKVFWYSSIRYRMGIRYDKDKQKTEVIDFRGYYGDLAEPYFASSNNEHTLSIYIPSYLDKTNNSEDVWDVSMGKLQEVVYNDEKAEFIFEAGKLALDPELITVEQQNVVVPVQVRNATSLTTQKTRDGVTIQPKDHWLVPQNGVIFSELSESGIHELARKRIRALLVLFVIGAFIGLISLARSHIVYLKKVVIVLAVMAILTCFSYFWYLKNSITYSVSQSEIDVLSHLSFMPTGRVLVYDHECLGCEWSSTYKPAAYANQKGYVKKYGKHPIVYNAVVFEAKTQEGARREFQLLDAKYIYLVKYDGLAEKIPFSPGDLNIEKVYANANAELWRMKE